jgi:hypothetical protein
MRAAINDVLAQFGEQLIATASKTLKGTWRIKLTARQIDAAVNGLESLAEALTSAIEEPMTDMIEAGGRGGVRRLNELSETLNIGFDVTNPEVAARISEQSSRLASDISRVTIDRVSNILRSALEDGSPPRDIATAIEDTGMFSRSRAEAIARTESANAFVDGEKEAWKQSGVVQGVKWLLAPNACEFCQSVAAQFNDEVVALDQPFFKVGDTVIGTEGGRLNINYRDITGPPLHPNDRCDLVPVLTEQ